MSRMPNGVRLKPDAMVGMNDSALIVGSWIIDWPAGYRNAARTAKPWKIAPPRLTWSQVPPFDYVIVLRAHHDGWPGDRPVAFEGNVGDLTGQAAHRDLVPGQREGLVLHCDDEVEVECHRVEHPIPDLGRTVVQRRHPRVPKVRGRDVEVDRRHVAHGRVVHVA